MSNLQNHISTTAKIQRVHATNPFAPRITKKIKMQTHQPKLKEKEEKKKKEEKEEKHITHVKGRTERGKKHKHMNITILKNPACCAEPKSLHQTHSRGTRRFSLT